MVQGPLENGCESARKIKDGRDWKEVKGGNDGGGGLDFGDF